MVYNSIERENGKQNGRGKHFPANPCSENREKYVFPSGSRCHSSLSLSKELYIVMICRLHFSNSSMSFNSDSKNGQPFRRPLRSHPARRTGPDGGQHVYFVPYRSSTPSLPLSSSLLSRQSSSGSSITKFRQLLATPPPRLPRANARFKL